MTKPRWARMVDKLVAELLKLGDPVSDVEVEEDLMTGSFRVRIRFEVNNESYSLENRIDCELLDVPSRSKESQAIAHLYDHIVDTIYALLTKEVYTE